jgi:hypothetical protein
MSHDYLAPRTGPGLQPAVKRGTGPNLHGRVIAPPHFSLFGGFVSPTVEGGPVAEKQISIHKPGSFEK